MQKQVFFYKEYNPKETTLPLLATKRVANFREDNICTCTMELVADSIAISSNICNLNPALKEGFAKIKRFVIDSVLNN